MQHMQLITGDVTEIRDGYAIVREGETVRTFLLAWYRIPRVEVSSTERKPDGGDAA